MASDSFRADHKVMNAFLWLLQIGGAVAFCLVGAAKIVGREDMVQLFAAVGFGQWLRFVTGALEVSGAMALLFPSTAALGAALLVVVMTGAVVANVTLLHTSPLVPFGLLIMVAIIAIGRHRRRHHIMRPALGHRAAMH